MPETNDMVWRTLIQRYHFLRFESKSISNNTDRQSRTLQADDTIACEVGRGANPAKLTYTITRDGRSYDLDDVKLKRCIHLSYNKKVSPTILSCLYGSGLECAAAVSSQLAPRGLPKTVRLGPTFCINVVRPWFRRINMFTIQ